MSVPLGESSLGLEPGRFSTTLVSLLSRVSRELPLGEIDGAKVGLERLGGLPATISLGV